MSVLVSGGTKQSMLTHTMHTEILQVLKRREGRDFADGNHARSMWPLSANV